MRCMSLALALAMALPAAAQDEEKLRKEIEKLKAENAVLQRQLDILQTESKRARKPLSGKVQAVSNEIDLVVISIGKDDGIQEGDEFTIYRNRAYIATIVIDRLDSKWSAAKVTKKKDDPRVADDVANDLVVYAVPDASPVKPLSKGSADELRAIRKELDAVRKQVRELSDRLLPSWTDYGVAIEELSDEMRGHYDLKGGLMVRRVRENSPAEKAGLRRFDVVPDLTEAALVEALKKGTPIRVIRGGREQTLGK